MLDHPHLSKRGCMPVVLEVVGGGGRSHFAQCIVRYVCATFSAVMILVFASTVFTLFVGLKRCIQMYISYCTVICIHAPL